MRGVWMKREMFVITLMTKTSTVLIQLQTLCGALGMHAWWLKHCHTLTSTARKSALIIILTRLGTTPTHFPLTIALVEPKYSVTVNQKSMR